MFNTINAQIKNIAHAIKCPNCTSDLTEKENDLVETIK